MDTIKEMMFGSPARVSGEGREGRSSRTSPNSSHGRSAQHAAREHGLGLGITMEGRVKNEHGSHGSPEVKKKSPRVTYENKPYGSPAVEEKAKLKNSPRLKNDPSEHDNQKEHSHPNPRFRAPPHTHDDDNIIPSTDFAIQYRSTFTDRHHAAHPSAKLCEQFSHLNCSYLSTPHHAPSLTQLKQHARALILVIRDLSISSSPGTLGTGSFTDNKTWDFLSDLDAPWIPDTDTSLPQNRPVGSVLNTLSQPRAERREVYPVCPLYTEPDIETRDFVARPLGSAHMESLVRHAAGTLQLLDHALHSNGGLLSALPMEDDTSQADEITHEGGIKRNDGVVGDGRGRGEGKAAHQIARNTFLGQWIHFTRLLVSRTHELGRDLTQALDILAGTATIPKQLHGELTKRATVTSQDRFVMANSGDAVYGNLMKLLDAHPKSVVEEIKTVGREHVVDAHGNHVYDRGEPVYRDIKALVANRGIVYVDVITRYAKLRGGRTIFVTPNQNLHSAFGLAEPGASEHPTVVQVAVPGFSSRVSEWEDKYRGLIQRAYAAEQRKVPAEQVLQEQAQEMRDLREVWETNDMLAEKSKLAALVASKDKERDDLLGLLERLRGVVNGYRRGCGEEEMDESEVDELAARARKEAEESVLRGLRQMAEGRSAWVDREDPWGLGREEVELPKEKTKVKTEGEIESPKKSKARDPLKGVKTAEEDEHARRHRELYDIPELFEPPTEDETEQEQTDDEDDEMPDLEDLGEEPYGYLQVDPNATFDETELGATKDYNEYTGEGFDYSGEDNNPTGEGRTTANEDTDSKASLFDPSSRNSSSGNGSDNDSDAAITAKQPTKLPSKQKAKPSPPKPIVPPGKSWEGIVEKLSPRSIAAITEVLRMSFSPAQPSSAPKLGKDAEQLVKKKRSRKDLEDDKYGDEEVERGMTDAQKRRRRRRIAKDLGLHNWRDVEAGSESEEDVEPEEVRRELEEEGLLGEVGDAAKKGRRRRTHSKADGGRRDRDVTRQREEQLQPGLQKEHEEPAKYDIGDEDLMGSMEE